MPDSGKSCVIPIAHMIPRIPSFAACRDECLYGGGGFSVEMKFWWHLAWPEEVRRHTKMFLPDNKSGKMISINVLKYATIIFNYAVALTVLDYNGFGDDIHPFLLNWEENTSAVRWTDHACKKSLVGKALGRHFCTLLIDSPLGVKAKWLSMSMNVIADDISRFKKDSPDYNFDYHSLQPKYPQLRDCRLFQPSVELLSIILGVM